MSMIKINVNVPAGPHYAQYTVEVPIEAIETADSETGLVHKHDKIAGLAALTISLIHKSTVNQQTAQSHTQLPASPDSKGSCVRNLQEEVPIDLTNSVTIVLVDMTIGREMAYSIQPLQSVHAALKAFESQKVLLSYIYTMYLGGQPVHELDTPHSLGIKTGQRFEVYREIVRPEREVSTSDPGIVEKAPAQSPRGSGGPSGYPG